MREFAFIADDLGRSREINAAILQAHREGVLTGASLMVGQPATDEAVALAKACPTLQIGWHMHLCDSVPTTQDNWPWGISPVAAGIRLGVSPTARTQMHAEIRRQWELFQATGLACHFINSHHHLHLHPVVLREIRDVVKVDFRGWLRGDDYRLFGGGPLIGRITRLAGRCLGSTLRRIWPVSRTHTIWGVDRLHAMNAADIAAAQANLPPGRHEFIFHPGAQVPDADRGALLALRALYATTGGVTSTCRGTP